MQQASLSELLEEASPAAYKYPQKHKSFGPEEDHQVSEAIDPYYEWLGISPNQPPNHYRLLALGPFEENLSVIAHAANRQMIRGRDSVRLHPPPRQNLFGGPTRSSGAMGQLSE